MYFFINLIITGFLFLIPINLMAANSFPEKPIRLIIPVSPSGGTDRMGRLFGEKFSRKTSQPVIIDNRTGAGGNIAGEILYKSPADGYTLMFTSSAPLVINKSLYRNLTYNPNNFEPVSIFANLPLVLAANYNVQPNNIKDLITFIKLSPTQLNYGSAGNGSISHLLAELFKSIANVNMAHIPYKGAAPALVDMLGGRIHIMFVELNSALPHVHQKKIKVFAVVNNKSVSLLPEVPLIKDFFPDFLATSWWGIVAPPNTSSKITNFISNSTRDIISQNEVFKYMLDSNIESIGSTPEVMRDILTKDRILWSKIIKNNNIQAD